MIDYQRSAYLISYGILIGTSFYTTFISGIIQFKTLPKLVFGNLQSKQFPPYFLLQSILSLHLWWATANINTELSNSWNRHAWLLSFLSALSNLIVIGPMSTAVMFERHALVKKDKKVPSALNTKFSVLHGISSTLNLVIIIACMYNSIWLGGALNI